MTLSALPRRKLAYSREEAADATSVSVDTIRRAINSGQLRAKKVGTRVVVTEQALIAWLEERPDA